MKRMLFLLYFLCIGLNGYALPDDDNEDDAKTATKEITWLSLEEALALNEQSPKKFLIKVVTEWCAACKYMDRTTYKDPRVIELINKHFYAVAFDAQSKNELEMNGQLYGYNEELLKGGVHDLAVELTKGRLTFPTTVFLNEFADNPQPVTGFRSVEELDQLMAFFGENYYINTAWNVFLDFYTD